MREIVRGLLALASPATAETRIKVRISPTVFRDDTGAPTGFGVVLLGEIAVRLGWSPEYVIDIFAGPKYDSRRARST